VTSDLRHLLGRRGEQLAAEHYERLGFRILARNHRTRYGELDLVLEGDGLLVFCEVKSRRLGSGSPWDALHDAKRAQVRKMGAAYLAEVKDRPWSPDLRFDAVGVVIDAGGALVGLEHLEAAF
jgi:putative endonuclease